MDILRSDICYSKNNLPFRHRINVSSSEISKRSAWSVFVSHITCFNTGSLYLNEITDCVNTGISHGSYILLCKFNCLQWTYCSITGPISMGQCDALSAKHSVQTCFNIVFCCCDGNCWKYSLSFACFTHAIKICANTLKFNVWFAALNASGIIGGNIIFDVWMRCCCFCCCCCCFTSSKIFDRIIGFCFRGPRSSCTASWMLNEFSIDIAEDNFKEVRENRTNSHH